MDFYVEPEIGRKVFLYSVTSVITSDPRPPPPGGFQTEAQFPGQHDKQARPNHLEETDPKLATSSKHYGGGGVEFIKGSST